METSALPRDETALMLNDWALAVITNECGPIGKAARVKRAVGGVRGEEAVHSWMLFHLKTFTTDNESTLPLLQMK